MYSMWGCSDGTMVLIGSNTNMTQLDFEFDMARGEGCFFQL